MTGTPSEAGKQIRELICRKNPHFNECCCAAVVGKFWRDVLPPEVRNAVASFDLETEFDKALDHADNVFRSVKLGANPMVSRVAAVSLDETLPALQHDVAAYKAGAKPKQQKGQQQQQRRGPRKRKQYDPDDRDTWDKPHRDWAGKTPPQGVCMQHYRFGKSAHYCRLPDSCPWQHISNPPNDQK